MNEFSLLKPFGSAVKSVPVVGVVYLAAAVALIGSSIRFSSATFSFRGVAVFILLLLLLIFLSIMVNSLHAKHRDTIATLIAFGFVPLVIAAPYYLLMKGMPSTTEGQTVEQRIEAHRVWQQNTIATMQRDIDSAAQDSTLAGKHRRIDMQMYMELFIMDTFNLNQQIGLFNAGATLPEQADIQLHEADSLQNLRLDSFNLIKNNK